MIFSAIILTSVILPEMASAHGILSRQMQPPPPPSPGNQNQFNNNGFNQYPYPHPSTDFYHYQPPMPPSPAATLYQHLEQPSTQQYQWSNNNNNNNNNFNYHQNQEDLHQSQSLQQPNLSEIQNRQVDQRQLVDYPFNMEYVDRGNPRSISASSRSGSRSNQYDNDRNLVDVPFTVELVDRTNFNPQQQQQQNSFGRDYISSKSNANGGPSKFNQRKRNSQYFGYALPE